MDGWRTDSASCSKGSKPRDLKDMAAVTPWGFRVRWSLRAPRVGSAKVRREREVRLRWNVESGNCRAVLSMIAVSTMK